MITLTEHDDGGRIRVRVGDVIEVRLAENASTGYRWAPDGLDPRMFELTEATADYPDPTPGSGGQARLCVTARAAGTVVLRLKYWRHWEGEAGVLRRYAVDVDVLP